MQAPIPCPPKILCVGLNHNAHAEETKMQLPSVPTIFAKFPTAVIGPGASIVLPKSSTQTDYEAEFAFVIGEGGRHIPASEWRQHVFGYTIMNDVSARDYQMATSQWVLGKSFDTHAPFGPWITTADEVGDPHTLGVRSFVNGEKRQDSNTSHFVFGVWDQIEHVSQVMTLEPGDLLFTGTPGGVGMAMKPPRYLRAGDRARVEVDKLGFLEGICRPEE